MPFARAHERAREMQQPFGWAWPQQFTQIIAQALLCIFQLNYQIDYFVSHFIIFRPLHHLIFALHWPMFRIAVVIPFNCISTESKTYMLLFAYEISLKSHIQCEQTSVTHTYFFFFLFFYLSISLYSDNSISVLANIHSACWLNMSNITIEFRLEMPS